MVGPTFVLRHEIEITRRISSKARVKDFLYKTWLFLPNIVLRNLGLAGRQLPIAMLSQWGDIIAIACVSFVKLFFPKYTYSLNLILHFHSLHMCDFQVQYSKYFQTDGNQFKISPLSRNFCNFRHFSCWEISKPKEVFELLCSYLLHLIQFDGKFKNRIYCVCSLWTSLQTVNGILMRPLRSLYHFEIGI